jgi:hypothetical protein
MTLTEAPRFCSSHPRNPELDEVMDAAAAEYRRNLSRLSALAQHTSSMAGVAK